MTTSASATCVILAGGLGTRLRSVIADRPKCLAPVGRRTFLEIQIETLRRAGINSVVLSLGYMAEQVLAVTAVMNESTIIRHVVEHSPLGTGGAVAHALDSLDLDEVLIANGDTYLDGDISGLFTPLDRENAELFRMAVVDVPDRARYGGVDCDANGRVRGFIEKGQHGTGCINAGLYRLCRAALPPSGQDTYSLEADVLPALVQRGHVRAHRISGTFIDIGVPADYERFCQRYSDAT